MNWKHLPIALLCVSVFMVALGLGAIFDKDLGYLLAAAPTQTEPVHLILIGTAGCAFVAWLKR